MIKEQHSVKMIESQHIIQQSPAPTPQLPQSSKFTEAQWTVLCSLVEAVIPSILPDGTASAIDSQYLNGSHYASTRDSLAIHGIDKQLAEEFLSEAPTATPEYREGLTRLLFHGIDADQRKQLMFIVAVLDSRASILLTGYSTPFPRLSVEQRQSILNGWATARLPVYRDLHRSLTVMAKSIWTRVSPSLSRILRFPKTPVNHNFGPGFPFEFIQIPPSSESSSPNAEFAPEIIETDILIIGSGCTGAVAASVLSAAGISVLVADKGYHWSPKFLPMSETNGLAHLFHNGGFTIDDSGNMNLVAGSCFGGGGTVNWSASLQLQGFVRQQWASHGLPYFMSGAFQADMDAVCERMGAGTEAVKQNYGNARLLGGARKLGMSAKVVPQNTGGEAHECGYCTLGCGSCGKKGPTESWLPDAARNGAQLMEGFACSRVLFSKGKGGEMVAIGAEGEWTSRDEYGGVAGTRYTRPVKIIAKEAVIVASGSLGTPHLLQRSGIKNPHLGSHLKLHPVSFLAAVYDDEVRPWEGGILTSVVSELENIGSSGYGVKLEGTVMLPSLFLPLFPWMSGLEWKMFCAKMRRMTGYIALARDMGEGNVYVDPNEESRLRVNYPVDKRDRKHIAMGLVALAKITFIEGAREIYVSVPGIPTFVREGDSQVHTAGDGINDPAFAKWLAQLERLVTHGMPAKTSFASAHQMGTARMGSSRGTSVVDSKGRVWGTSNLFVCDTSVFPAASGVNPMITTMATARGIARGIAESFGRVSVAEEARARL